MIKSIASIALLFSTAIAVPTPTELLPRACTTLAPAVINTLDAANPNTPYSGQQFTLERSGSPLIDNKISVLTFSKIPAGATGCRLEIELPPLSDGQIAPSNTQADVWSADPGDGSSLPTYNHPPHKREMVATYIFPKGPTTKATHTVLASNTCSTTMSWLVQLSEWQSSAGSVNFQNSVGNGADIGFMLVYNC
ncbi:hypothetical protein BDV30DRAFT_204157 [Aspergillus minisclerotigenes]|uniref:Ubiquitin 3 binding protein But2 C-terminal domain-containing protein n=1 Tax=Aspergillus minisclerotigenes TaxID=656917 RepID=A0A5N6JIF2_9EURO|nr:hypothetical protein BDV30DRAFT_204157 [Aspergillus minisclerotigenes]